MKAAENGTMDDVNGALHQHSPLDAQLQAILNILPAHAWYALPNGALTFLNGRIADYLGLPKDHPQRFGTDTGADWDSNLAFLPDRGARRVHAKAHALQDASGNREFVGAVTDITEQARAVGEDSPLV
jgi:PAS domain-containing protein